MSTRVPIRWQQAMDESGLTSCRKLAIAADLSVETVRSAILGRRRSVAPATTAELLEHYVCPRSSSVDTWGWVGGTSVTYTPAETSPPAQRERDAVDEIIRLLIQTR